MDTVTNALSAWSIATSGSPVLDEHEQLTDPELRGLVSWVIDSPRGPVAQYPPGAAYLAAPAYALFGREAPMMSLTATRGDQVGAATIRVPSVMPGAVIAALTTAGAMGLVALLVLELGGSIRGAVLTGFVGGLGTSAWSVAADALWQHGPNMFWLTLGVLLVVRSRWLAAGLAFSMLILTRPPVLLIGIALGVMLIVQRRFRPAALLALGSLPGACALLLYNWWIFGDPSVTGGYGSGITGRATDLDLVGYLGNIGDMLVAPRYGVLVWSPFLALLAVGVIAARSTVPDWAKAAAIGGLMYLLVQLKLNSAAGGLGFQYYRYPLETLAAMGPLLYLSWQHLWASGNVARAALVTTTSYGVVVHAVAAIG